MRTTIGFNVLISLIPTIQDFCKGPHHGFFEVRICINIRSLNPTDYFLTFLLAVWPTLKPPTGYTN